MFYLFFFPFFFRLFASAISSVHARSPSRILRQSRSHGQQWEIFHSWLALHGRELSFLGERAREYGIAVTFPYARPVIGGSPRPAHRWHAFAIASRTVHNSTSSPYSRAKHGIRRLAELAWGRVWHSFCTTLVSRGITFKHFFLEGGAEEGMFFPLGILVTNCIFAPHMGFGTNTLYVHGKTNTR